MKKILSVVALSAVIFTGSAMTAADNAEAYFDDGNLWRVVYDDALNYEVVTDLGNTNTLMAAGSSIVGGGADAWNIDMFPVGTAYSDLNVAYFACDDTFLFLDPETYMPTYQDDGWVSGAAGGQTSGLNTWGLFVGAVTGMQTEYTKPGTGTATVVGSIGGYNTYWANMNISGGETGSFALFVPVPNGSEAELGVLADEGGYVDQYLYFWDDPRADPHAGDLVASIRTHADGSTTVVNAVPVPATVLLFGSGLLGLMGVKRRSGK